jgi:hypothetical protein
MRAARAALAIRSELKGKREPVPIYRLILVTN